MGKMKPETAVVHNESVIIVDLLRHGQVGSVSAAIPTENKGKKIYAN